MKYIFYMFICTLNFVWGAEIDKENSIPENTNRGSVHLSYAKIDSITRRISELEMARNRYTSFISKYDEELDRLDALSFFEADFADKNAEVMSILHDIFSNKMGGENWHTISYEFKNHPIIFLKELGDLKERIKTRGLEPNEELKGLLNEMSESFFITQWMIIYYWNNKDWFLIKS